MYRKGDKYLTKRGRTYFFIEQPGSPGGKFKEAIHTYVNALINTNGGIIVFGVENTEHVKGFTLSRQMEDDYKCSFDAAIREMRPTIHPHQYRLDVLYLNYQQQFGLFEIRISAGDPAEIYENLNKEMFIVKEKRLYGPLFPCEIRELVVEKYKEEFSSLQGKTSQSAEFSQPAESSQPAQSSQPAESSQPAVKSSQPAESSQPAGSSQLLPAEFSQSLTAAKKTKIIRTWNCY